MCTLYQRTMEKKFKSRYAKVVLTLKSANKNIYKTYVE